MNILFCLKVIRQDIKRQNYC